MDTFGQVAKVTFILLLCCTELTEQANPDDTTMARRWTKSTTTTQSYEDYLKEKRAKLLYFEYYPNYGYEPYWADGEWVLNMTDTSNAAAVDNTTIKLKVCGEACGYLFRRVHEVCGRKSTDLNEQYYGCGSSWWHWQASIQCSGYGGINFSGIFRTFKTYCDFLNAQCKAKFYDKFRWVLVHVGKCKPVDRTYDDNGYFGTQWWSKHPYMRQIFYLSSLNPTSTTTRKL